MDDELNALRKKLQGGAKAVALPSAEISSSQVVGSDFEGEIEVVKVAEVDADLEALKRSIDQV